MKAVVNKLSLEDINAVASWIAAQPLPADVHPALSLPALKPGSTLVDCGSAPLAGAASPAGAGQ